MTIMDIPPLMDMTVPLYHITLPLVPYEEVSTDLVHVMPFKDSVSIPPAHPGTGLLAGYRALTGVIGEDCPLADLIQFGRLNLNTSAIVPPNPSTVTPMGGSNHGPSTSTHRYQMAARNITPASRVLVTGATRGVGGNPPRIVTPPLGTMTVSVQPHVATPRPTVASGPPPQLHVHVAHTLPPLVITVQ